MKIGLYRNIKTLFKLSSPNACVGDPAALGTVSHWVPVYGLHLFYNNNLTKKCNAYVYAASG